MKHFASALLIALAIIVTPRDPHEAAALAVRTAIVLIHLSMRLDSHWYDAGYDAETDDGPEIPQQDA